MSYGGSGLSTLDLLGSSSVGLWFGMFSVLCSSGAIDSHDMATIWSRCMRRAHISTEDDQPLPTFAPPRRRDFAPDSPSRQQTESVLDETPICSRTLWRDAIERLQEGDAGQEVSRSVSLEWPDLSESIVIQKLQMLQFCIAMRDESPIYHFPTETVSFHVKESILRCELGRTSECTGAAEVEIANPSSTLPDATGVPAVAHELTSSNSNESQTATIEVTVRQPPLFRRLPLTEDVVAMNKYLSRKVNASNSRSNRAHPTLKAQLQFPSILSDMKAFKAENPGLNLRVFCLWYGIAPIDAADPTHTDAAAAVLTETAEADGTTEQSESVKNEACMNKAHSTDTPSAVEMAMGELHKAWESCEAQSCEDQGRPLFAVEKEAEKALAFLESVSAVQLATEMLCSGMRLLVGIATSQAEPWLSPEHLSDSAAHDGSALTGFKATLRSDLAVLSEQVELAVEHLTIPKSDKPTASSGDSSSAPQVSIAASILVDSVAGLLQRLEAVLVKMQTMQALLSNAKDHEVGALVYALARRDNCFAETDAEMAAMYDLAKSLRNFKEKIHDWHSKDGRELGQPTRKTFSCKLEQPRPRATGTAANGNLPHISHDGVSSDLSLRSHLQGSSIDTAKERVVREYQTAIPAHPTTAAALPLSEVFQMEAVVEGDLLRLSYRLPE